MYKRQGQVPRVGQAELNVILVEHEVVVVIQRRVEVDVGDQVRGVIREPEVDFLVVAGTVDGTGRAGVRIPVVHVANVNTEALRDHIERVGIPTEEVNLVVLVGAGNGSSAATRVAEGLAGPGADIEATAIDRVTELGGRLEGTVGDLLAAEDRCV